MEKYTLSSGDHPEMVIENVSGNLSIKGWERPEINVEAEREDVTIDERDGVVRINCRSDCSLQVPRGASVRAQHVAGHADIKMLDGRLHIGEVKESLMMLDVSATVIARINGDLSLRGMAGDLLVEVVQSNAAVRDIHGSCSLDEVGGNLVLRKISGEIQAACQGNARLVMPALAKGRCQIRAGGDIHCRIPEAADAALRLESAARSIHIKLPARNESLEEESTLLVLGAGKTSLELSSGGAIYLAGLTAGEPDFDWAGSEYAGGSATWSEDYQQGIADRVEAQITTQIETITQQMNANITQLLQKIRGAGISPEQTERIVQRALQTSERETHRAADRIRRAQEKLERKLATSQRRAGFKTRFPDEGAHASAQAARNFERAALAAPDDPVSEEERLVVLRMLEQKKINIEQAQQLLDALEGEPG